MNHNFSIHPNIEKAATLPSEFYRSPTVFEELKSKVFLQSWQYIGDERTLKLRGQVEPFILLDQFLTEPMLLTRGENMELNCLSNVCTHRGNIVVDNPGSLRKLTCMYHGRRFDLKGKFEHMPEFGKAENFPRECDSLHRFQHLQMGPWIFAEMGGNINFSAIIEEMERRVGFLPFKEFSHDTSRDQEYIVNAHWALYCDNYLEGFHIPFVHKDLNQALDYGNYTTELFDYGSLQIGYADKGTEIFDLPDGHPDHGKKVAAYYFWIYPNMMFNFYPWGLSINIVRPLGPEKTRVSFITFVWKESMIGTSAGALLDKVEREDEKVVEGVQKGIRSNYYPSGRYSPDREKGVHHFHRMISEALK